MKQIWEAHLFLWVLDTLAAHMRSRKKWHTIKSIVGMHLARREENNAELLQLKTLATHMRSPDNRRASGVSPPTHPSVTLLQRGSGVAWRARNWAVRRTETCPPTLWCRGSRQLGRTPDSNCHTLARFSTTPARVSGGSEGQRALARAKRLI